MKNMKIRQEVSCIWRLALAFNMVDVTDIPAWQVSHLFLGNYYSNSDSIQSCILYIFQAHVTFFSSCLYFPADSNRINLCRTCPISKTNRTKDTSFFPLLCIIMLTTVSWFFSVFM